MISSRSFVFNTFMEKTYILWDETKEAIVVDPGCYEKAEKEELTSFILSQELKITSIVNTHCHIDHVLGNDFLKEKYKAPLLIPEGEHVVLRAVKSYAPQYGFPLYRECEPDGYLNTSEGLLFGKSKLEILSLPGHSPDHVGFFDAHSNNIFSGDVLFYRSIGRTDLPGGSHQTLINSIHTKLFELPNEVVVYPGHGQNTTIGEEKSQNPFCAISD